MLSLKSSTAPRWVADVEANLDEVLIDHAHCEKKAAGVAMNLIFAYIDNVELVRELSAIVNEELEHLSMVLELLARRGVPFRRLKPGSYGQRLHELIRTSEPDRAVDRLLIAGLIEARSCERFALLKDHVSDPELAKFYGGLFESEARHHSTYVRLAAMFAPLDEVLRRLEELAVLEAEVVATSAGPVRMHST